MAELINLRTARKRAKRRQDEALADANRLAHGQPKHQRAYTAAQAERANRNLDAHRIDKGDRR
jgi:hypothetical protein